MEIKLANIIIRGIIALKRREEIIEALKAHEIDIAALTETHAKQVAKEQGKEYTFFFGHNAVSKQEYAGVGLAVKTKLVSAIIKIHAGSPRVLSFSFDARPRPVNVIVACAPTAKADLGEKEAFYS